MVLHHIASAPFSPPEHFGIKRLTILYWL